MQYHWTVFQLDAGNSLHLKMKPVFSGEQRAALQAAYDGGPKTKCAKGATERKQLVDAIGVSENQVKNFIGNAQRKQSGRKYDRGHSLLRPTGFTEFTHEISQKNPGTRWNPKGWSDAWKSLPVTEQIKRAVITPYASSSAVYMYMEENILSHDTVVAANASLEVAASDADDDKREGPTVLSHKDAMDKLKRDLSEIISTDPLLCDLPREITEEEINSQIALEYGQAMMVNVRRADDIVMPIVVTQNATVLDLKHAIKRYITLKQSREGGKTHISWRYTWKRYWLYYEGQKLSEDHKRLKDYDIRNRDEVTFVKRLKER